MIDDILAEIIGEAAFGKLSKSRRAEVLMRLFFGLLGTGLAIAGAVHFGFGKGIEANTPMRLNMALLFVLLGCFCLFNITLARPRWPGLLFVLSLVGLFVTRIVFGK